MKAEKRAHIRVLIADDHPIVRHGLRQAIDAGDGLAVVYEAGDGRTALARLEEGAADVAVLDIDMPAMDGLALARAVRDLELPIAIVFLTIHREEDLFHEALDVGAKGYVLKDCATTDIVAAIKAVAAGQHYTSPAMTTYLVGRHVRAAALRQQKPTLEALTPTERRVLHMIADYKTSKEIADELCISYRTVETHRSNICTKLEIHGSNALMKFALTHKTEI
jgi:DNA-binding NarL/FixJ family response regulator